MICLPAVRDIGHIQESHCHTGHCTRQASRTMACHSCQMLRRQSWMLCLWSSCWKASRQHPGLDLGSSPLDPLPTGGFAGTSVLENGKPYLVLMAVEYTSAFSAAKRMLLVHMIVLSWAGMEGMQDFLYNCFLPCMLRHLLLYQSTPSVWHCNLLACKH